MRRYQHLSEDQSNVPAAGAEMPIIPRSRHIPSLVNIVLDVIRPKLFYDIAKAHCHYPPKDYMSVVRKEGLSIYECTSFRDQVIDDYLLKFPTPSDALSYVLVETYRSGKYAALEEALENLDNHYEAILMAMRRIYLIAESQKDRQTSENLKVLMLSFIRKNNLDLKRFNYSKEIVGEAKKMLVVNAAGHCDAVKWAMDHRVSELLPWLLAKQPENTRIFSVKMLVDKAASEMRELPQPNLSQAQLFQSIRRDILTFLETTQGELMKKHLSPLFQSIPTFRRGRMIMWFMSILWVASTVLIGVAYSMFYLPSLIGLGQANPILIVLEGLNDYCRNEMIYDPGWPGRRLVSCCLGAKKRYGSGYRAVNQFEATRGFFKGLMAPYCPAYGTYGFDFWSYNRNFCARLTAQCTTFSANWDKKLDQLYSILDKFKSSQIFLWMMVAISAVSALSVAYLWYRGSKHNLAPELLPVSRLPEQLQADIRRVSSIFANTDFSTLTIKELRSKHDALSLQMVIEPHRGRQLSVV